MTRPLGRPPVADKRRLRSIKFNDAEWAKVADAAEALGMTCAAYVRMRLGV